MESTQSLGRNTMYSGLSAASNVLLVVLVVLAARVLGDRAFGQFSFALAIASIFEMLIDLGLNTLIARNVARDRRLALRYLPNILTWKLLLSVAAMGLLVITVRLLGQGPEARTAAYILGIGIVLRSFMATSHAFFQSHERFDLVLLTTYVERLSVFILGLSALFFVGKLIPFCLVFAIARIPVVILAYWLLSRHVTSVRLDADTKMIRSMQKAALPFASYTLIAVLYASIGTVILSALRSPEEVGWYNAGYKIYEGLTMFPAFMAAAALPRLSRLFVMDRDGHRNLSVRLMRYLPMASFPIAVGVGYLSSPIVRLLFGAEYLPAVFPLQILLGAAVLMFANVMLNTVLISADQQSVAVRVAGVGLVVMTCSNLLLVSRLGMVGAAASVAVSETLVLAMLLLASRRRLFPLSIRAHIWKPLTASLVAVVAVWVFRSGPVSSAVIFVLLYIACMLAMRPFSAGEWAELRSVFLPARTDGGNGVLKSEPHG